jgi:DNA polymerase-3 subunit gamma/tau
VTVLSRCLQFNLRPMAPETVFEHLTQVLAAEQLSAEPLALRLLARAARGSMRDALSLTDQAIAFGNGQLQEAGVRQMLGSVDRSHVLQLIRALTDGDGATVVSQVNALRMQGVSAAATLEDMAMLLQRMAVMQMVPSMAQDGDDPDTQGLADLAQAMPAEETQLLYSLCLHGRTELGLAPDEYAALTMVLLRLLAFKPQASTAEKKSPRTSTPPVAEARSSSLTSAAPAATLAKVSAPERTPAPALTPAPSALAVAPPKPPAEAARPAAFKPSADMGDQPHGQATGSTVHSPVPGHPAASSMPLTSSEQKADGAPMLSQDGFQPEPPPWEDWPDTTDYCDVVPQAPWQPVADAQSETLSAPASLRSLPVREASEPSVRLDRPRQSAPETVQATPEGDVWLAVVQGLMAQEAITALVRELALQSQLLARDAVQWQLRVERETLNHTASRERLQAALLAAGHGDVQLRIEIWPVTDSPAKRLAELAAAKMDAAHALIQNDPLVQAMVRDFGAKIVPGSVQLI